MGAGHRHHEGRRRSALATSAAVGALSLALSVALSGCSLLGLPDPGATHAPTATPTPTPAFALDCTALVSATDLTTLLGDDAKPTDPTAPSGAALLVAAAGPFAVSAAGGASCDWSRAADALSIELLPHAADSWAKLAAQYPEAATPGADYEGGVSLGGDCALDAGHGGSACRTNVLVDGAWLAVSLTVSSNPDLTEAGFHDAVQRMLPTVSKALPAAPAARAASPVDCAADDLRAQVQQTFARPAATLMTTGQTFGLPSAIAISGGVALCTFQVGEEEGSDYLGSLSILPDGARVYETFRQSVLKDDASAHSDTITVGGASVPALVWSGEIEGTPFSSVDTLVGSDWVQFHTTDPDTDHSLALVQWVAGKL